MLASASPSLTFPKVRRHDQATGNCIKVTLFRGPDDRIRAWYIGPLARSQTGGVTMPFLRKRQATLALIAILRAEQTARTADIGVCIVDPDNLWTSIWA